MHTASRKWNSHVGRVGNNVDFPGIQLRVASDSIFVVPTYIILRVDLLSINVVSDILQQ